MLILPDHDVYTRYKSSVRSITLTDLIKVLSSYKLCLVVENGTAKKSSTPYTLPHKIKHCSTSLNKPNIFRSDLCHVLVKMDKNVNFAKNIRTPVFPKQKKFPRDSQ